MALCVDGRRWVPGVGRSRVGVSCTRLAVTGGLVTHRVRAPPGQPERPGPVGNRLRPGREHVARQKHVDQAFACEGADENSWQSRPQGDCSRPSSRHVAAGREHDSKQCRTPSSLCREPSRCALAFRLGRLRRRHYQRGRQQDFVPGMRVPRSGLPRVFDSALAYISMQTPGGRCICTRSCLTRAKHSWRTCRISAAITDTCTATTAGSVHTATVRYQDKPPHTHRRGEGSA